MKKRYVFALVVTAMIALAALGFAVYKYWGSIVDVWNFTKTKIKSIKLPTIKSKPANPVDPKTILATVQPDTSLVNEKDALSTKTTDINNTTNVVTQNTVKTINVEADTKAAQGAPVAAIVVENTKQREAKNQQAVSKAYTELIKDIHEEKAKGAVLLTAIRTENARKQKLDALDVDALDTEEELYAENMIRPHSGFRRPVSKKLAEFYMAKGYL